MKKLYILMLFMLVFFVSSCGLKEREITPSAEILETYQRFLDIFSTGTEDEFNALLYYDQPEFKELTEGFFENCTEYEILQWEKLSGHLWAVTAHIRMETKLVIILSA